MNKDSLGTRMKEHYENRYRFYLPRRSYTIIRIDGRAFHTYTRDLQKPFDRVFMEDMKQTTLYLVKNISGAQFGYLQSDEISILLTDFDTINTQAWFDNNLQKICSVSASMATMYFNGLRSALLGVPEAYATFDSRVFQIPQQEEVENYFIWRQQDATRNSISALAQSLYPHSELEGKNTSDLQEMCFQKGKNWNDLPVDQKRGSVIKKNHVYHDPPIFTQDRNFLQDLIPANTTSMT